MAYQLVIVSEDPEIASALSHSAANLGPRWNSIILDDNSVLRRMRGRIEACDQSAAAMIVAVSDAERGINLLEAVKQDCPEITTAAAHPAPTSSLILGAMRAGASEFLTPPYNLSPLAERVEKRSVAAEQAQRGMLFCFMPAKGASGASTVALHLAQSISQVLEERVLVVDFDFHSGASAFRLRLKPAYTLAEALERTSQVRELWPRLVTRWNKLDILPAPSSSSVLPTAVLKQVPEFFRAARASYPCVIVDLPDAVLASCREVLGIADCVFLVCTPEIVSMHLAKRKLNELVRAGISKDRIEIVVNRVNSGKALDVADISKLVGKEVYQTFVNAYEAVSDASLRGELIKEDSGLGHQFREFAARIVGSEEQVMKVDAKAEKQRSWASFFSMR